MPDDITPPQRIPNRVILVIETYTDDARRICRAHPTSIVDSVTVRAESDTFGVGAVRGWIEKKEADAPAFEFFRIDGGRDSLGSGALFDAEEVCGDCLDNAIKAGGSTYGATIETVKGIGSCARCASRGAGEGSCGARIDPDGGPSGLRCSRRAHHAGPCHDHDAGPGPA